MALFDAWFNAIIVLDANALLNLHERSAESSEQQLDILESFSEQIYIPRQFYDEYQNNLPAIANRVSKQYRVFGNNLHSNRDNTVKILIQLANQNNSDIASFIPEVNELYQMVVDAVSRSRKQHIARFFNDNSDTRINRLIDDKVGDPLPDSLLADIPAIWQWRLDRNIPPGLQDYDKPEPRHYGDLIGWFQIKRHAIGRGRPVIMVTDDVKANDWYVLKNGNPSGPHPELTRELYDEAGVELHLYTSEQFMLFARMYLKSRAMAEAAGEYFRRLTPTLLPDFGNIVATGSLSALTARVGIFNDFRHSLKALPGLTAGVTNKGLLDSISAVSAFSDRYNHSFSTLAGLTTNDNLKYIVDQLSSTTAVLKPYAELHRSTAHYMNSIREQQRMITDIVDPIREQQRMIADIVNPIREQQRMIADIVNPIREQQRMIADIVNPIREQQRKIADIVNPFREQQRIIADIVNPMREQQRMIADIVNPMREQQRMIADIVNPKREQQRTIDMLTKPMLSDVTKNSMLSISGIAKDLTPSVNDSNSLMKQFREE